ncbi:MAG: N-6 DNA methylase, partial [Pasteurella sp.]|nr:N-6 DNA methylase [Pasteurella sp.]
LRDFTDEDIRKIADTYHNWQRCKGSDRACPVSTDDEQYQDIAGFCKSATLADIADNDFVLTAGRYVGAEEVEDDGIPFAEKMETLTALLHTQFAQGRELEQQIVANLQGLGYE